MALDITRFLQAEAEGKALAYHPALTRPEPVSTYSPGAVRREAAITQREATRHLSAYGGDQAMDWVMDAVNLYGDTASTAEWYLSREGKKLLTQKDPDDPKGELAPKDLVTLLKRPNPYMLYDELVHLLVIDLLLVGNAYWFKWQVSEDGKPLALYRLAPSHVKVIPGAFGPKGYKYQPPNAKDPLIIQPENMMHFRRPNPHSAYLGLGVIQSGGRAFDLDLALTETMTAYYENNADPSLVVQSERRIPRDVFNKLRAQLRRRVSGPNKAGELLVLEAGLKAESLSPSARDALFSELTGMSRDRIFAMFRTSAQLFGYMDSASGSNKVADARREFDTKTMRPFLDRLQTRITEGLVAAWDLEFKIDYRYVMPLEELVKLAGDYATIPGIKVKEIRSFLASTGIPATTGDAEVDEMILNLPGEEMDENGQGGFADRPLPGEPGRPPKGENTKAFPRNTKARRPQGKALGLDEVSHRLQLLLDQRRIEEGKAVTFEQPERVSVGDKLSAEERPQDSLYEVRTRDVDDAVSVISKGLDDAAHTLERGLLDHVEGKAFNSNNLRSRVRNSEAWKTFMAMTTAALEEGARRASSAAAIHQGNAGVTPEDEIDYDAIVASVIHRPEGVRGITKTLKERVARNVGEVLSAGGGRDEVEARVREVLDFWRANQIETVALTEAVHAYNETTLTVAEEAGFETVIAEDGHDHDEPCAEMDGRVLSIEEARENRLEHPRCRRAFTPYGKVAA